MCAFAHRPVIRWLILRVTCAQPPVSGHPTLRIQTIVHSRGGGGGLPEGHSDLIETVHHVARGIQTGDGCRHVLVDNQGPVRRVGRAKGQGEF